MDSGAIRRRIALGMAVVTASGALALAASGNAHADPYCSGRKVRDLTFSTGVVHVYKADGYVCAVTFPKHASTTKRSMSVSVQARGNRPVVDSGQYSHHAGPVTVHAGHRCVRIKGSVKGGSVSSGWILC
ncbi:hypothetical protein ABZZ74_20705 [Streptomyces sp. NPDC006476]|uniref:hypothetical protein n=1 Tax=Streptomyces sp. NPDC006476 TaxID=3157175 RepID=UPI0033B7BCEB